MQAAQEAREAGVSKEEFLVLAREAADGEPRSKP